MNRVDKITAFLLGICILVVGVLAGMKVIDGSAALGFISGIGVALVGNATVRGVTAIKKTNSENQP